VEWRDVKKVGHDMILCDISDHSNSE